MSTHWEAYTEVGKIALERENVLVRIAEVNGDVLEILKPYLKIAPDDVRAAFKEKADECARLVADFKAGEARAKELCEKIEAIEEATR